MTSESKGTILMTGASGYVGAHILKEALDRGYNVRATTRSTSSAKKIADLFPEQSARISYSTVPDMTVVESYSDAFDGVTAVVHTASPFILAPEDVSRDLLDPAINGAVTILEAAKRYGGGRLKRVIFTSSHAAVGDFTLGTRPGYTYSEKDWNPMTYEEASKAPGPIAYCASKALAEKAMWKFMEESKPPFDLVSINPPWIFGPYATQPRSTKGLGESVTAVYHLLSADKVPDPDFCGFADVREAAWAHLQAAETPAAGGQRFWLGQGFNWQMAADAARKALPELRSRIPEGTPGQWAEQYAVDGSKATRVLGLKYRPLAETIRDTIMQLLEAEKAEQAAA